MKVVGKGTKRRTVLLGTAGGSSPGLVFVDWYGTGRKPPDEPRGSFTILIVEPDGVCVSDEWYQMDPIVEPYHAIGCGAKAAFVALDMGATALEAVEAAARRDPYTRGPFHTMTLK